MKLSMIDHETRQATLDEVKQDKALYAYLSSHVD